MDAIRRIYKMISCPLRNRRRTSSEEGFTLIELLIVIGILAFLAVVIVLVLNPAEILRKSRDQTRVSDISTIHSALTLFQADVSGGFLGNSSTTYVSIPDPAATGGARSDCASFGLPSLPAGLTYACTAPSAFHRVDGTGWIPVDFTKVSFRAPLTTLPVDPLNSASGGYYYTYTPGGSWELTANMESNAFRSGGEKDVEAKDGGDAPLRYEIGTNLALAPDIGEGTASSTALAVTSVSPPSGLLTGGTSVSVNGSGFAATPTVTFGGVPATSVALVNPSLLNATTPAHSAGLVDVVVTNPGGASATCSGCFTMNNPPSLSSLNPAVGSQGTTGLVIDVNGTNFQSGANASFSNADITVTNTTFVSPTLIRATVDIAESVSSGPGLRNITVTNPDSGAATLSNAFTVNYNSNLKGYWRMNDGSGATTADATANGNTGALMNSPTWLTSASCKEGSNCLSFNGTTQWVHVTSSVSIDIFNSPLTIAMWVYPSATSPQKVLLSKQGQYSVRLGNGANEFQLRDATSGAGVNATYGFSANAWQHVAYTLNSSRTNGALYVNGTPVSGAWVGTWGAITSNAFPIQIPSVPLFGGRIDAVRVYSTELNGTQIQAIYNAGN